jgi:tetratricopeptide (TPR) repeat protein
MLVLLATALFAQQPNALDLGRQALQDGDLTRAEQLFKEYATAHPDSAEAFSNWAIVYSRREQYDDAVKLYEKALKANPGLVPVHFNMAVSLGKLRRFDEAAAHLRTFLAAYPGEPRAQQLLGLCLVETGDPRGALAELDASFRANPRDASIVYSLAYAHARAGDEEQAARLLSQLPEGDPQVQLVQGWLQFRQQRYTEAKALFQEVLRKNPDSAPALAALGRVELNDHNDKEAIPLLERAIKLNPSDAESTYQLGVLLARNGRESQALPLLKRALTLRANYPDPHYHLGRLAFERGDLKTALSELELARKMLPNQESIRFYLGRTYQSLGRAADARREFDEVRRLKSETIENLQERVQSDGLMKR